MLATLLFHFRVLSVLPGVTGPDSPSSPVSRWLHCRDGDWPIETNSVRAVISRFPSGRPKEAAAKVLSLSLSLFCTVRGRT